MKPWKLASIVGCFSMAILDIGAASAADRPPIHTRVAVVLVHGAWADGSSWEKVIPLLQQQGVKVTAVQLQRASLAQDAAIVRRVVVAQRTPVVLVGHSYGGAVITEAGSVDKVKALVYVAAFAPGDGESIADITRPYPPGPWQAGFIVDPAGYVRLGEHVYFTYFAPDLPPPERAVLASTQGPVLASVLEDKVTRAAWHDRPVFWALPGNDQIIPTVFQRIEASRVGAHVTEIPAASHVPLLSRPRAVADVIMSAIAAVDDGGAGED